MSRDEIDPSTSFFEPFFLRAGRERLANRSPHTTLFFTASWHDSLIDSSLSSFAKILSERGIDVLSADLPFHYKGVSYDVALQKWESEAEKNRRKTPPLFIQQYIDTLASSLLKMEKKGLIHLQQFSISGLSRGAYIATRLIEKLQKPIPLILFAPMLEIGNTGMFPLSPSMIPKETPLFLSVGNNDTRIGTEKAIRFYNEYTNAIKEKQIGEGQRIKHVDTTLFIHPSIGFMGHGTSEIAFTTAALWLENKNNTFT